MPLCALLPCHDARQLAADLLGNHHVQHYGFAATGMAAERFKRSPHALHLLLQRLGSRSEMDPYAYTSEPEWKEQKEQRNMRPEITTLLAVIVGSVVSFISSLSIQAWLHLVKLTPGEQGDFPHFDGTGVLVVFG
jgi:hypothetical protein